MQLKTLQTKLETAKFADINAILDNKAELVGANGVTDYVGLSIDNIDNSINRIDEAIAELQAIKKDMKSQQDIIKIGVAKWLQDNGVDKLKGDLISSISVSAKAQTKELIVLDEESLINHGYFKVIVDKTAVKNALGSGVVLSGAKLEITYNEDTIRVNKKKK